MTKCEKSQKYVSLVEGQVDVGADGGGAVEVEREENLPVAQKEEVPVQERDDVQIIEGPQERMDPVQEVRILKRRLHLQGRRMEAFKRRITVLEGEHREQQENYNALLGKNGRLEDVIIDQNAQRAQDNAIIKGYRTERAAYAQCRECPVCYRQYNNGQAKPYMLEYGHATCGFCLDGMETVQPISYKKQYCVGLGTR
ncbi:unnamed protein product [Caenorhabditis nigoni]